jgi:hypothetical protein
MLPLIYGKDGDRYLIVASKGGAPEHPAWYVNLHAQLNVKVQVGADKFAGGAHGDEGRTRGAMERHDENLAAITTIRQRLRAKFRSLLERA